MCADGLGFRQIARQLKLSHSTVMEWAKAHAEQLPDAPVPEEVDTIEVDELYTFIEKKKNRIYILTFVDRETRCILAWKVSKKRTGYQFQEMLVESVQGHDYYTDDYQGYKTVLYSPAIHHPMQDKSRTYCVEGSNADLRHYSARLRRRSRCFSRCEIALRNAVKIFVFANNSRQLFKHHYPKYDPSLMSFSTP
jgi:insertion element IS1 protein InsB